MQAMMISVQTSSDSSPSAIAGSGLPPVRSTTVFSV